MGRTREFIVDHEAPVAAEPTKRKTYSVVERQKVALRVVETTLRAIERHGADARTVLISLAQHFQENPQPIVGPAGEAPKAPDLGAE